MKIFETQFHKGSFISNTGIVGTPTDVEFKRTEKGQAIFLESGKSITWTIPSSSITNIISFIGGVGTARISCGANNTDISVTGWTNTNSVVSYSGITTITLTATSGYIYIANVYLFNSISDF